VNSSGVRVVEYHYDAWGNLLSTTGSSGIGAVNPLRYRGYVYDEETGLYYVSSRYYDSEIGRWINADNQVSDVGGEVLGYNSFSYCFNNSVNMSDSTGNWPQWLIDTAKFVADKIINPVVETAKDALSKIDVTVTNGITIGGTVGIAGVTVTPSISADTKGNIAIQISGSWGITTGAGFGMTAGTMSMFTNAPNTDRLNGEAGVIGRSSFFPIAEHLSVGGGMDLNLIPDYRLNKMYYGISYFRGVSTAFGKETHVGPGNTITLFEFNMFKKYQDIYGVVMGCQS